MWFVQEVSLVLDFSFTYFVIVTSTCSNSVERYSLSVTIPANRNADIFVSKLAYTNAVITEGGKEVWKNNAYIPGVPGIKNAVDRGAGEVVFEVGSGSYQFQITGQFGNSQTISAAEGDFANLSCSGGRVISVIQFASFGTPSSDYEYGSCHAGSSRHVVEKYCLHKSSCSVDAIDDEFGDPCNNVRKSLKVKYICS